MRFVFFILFLLIIAKGYSVCLGNENIDSKNEEAKSTIQQDVDQTLVISVVLIDDTDTSDGLGYDCFVTLYQAALKTDSYQIAFSKSDFSDHRINLILPFFIDLPPPGLL